MKRQIYLFALAAVMITACGRKSAKTDETPTRGHAVVAVDETFFPMIEGQVQVFESRYKYARMDILCRPEAQIGALLLSDSVQLAVLSRELTPRETAHFEARKIIPRITEVAWDGIALIVSRENPDTLICAETLKAMLRGQNRSRTLVFDNPASGTVRSMQEFAGTDTLRGVYSLRSNREVIRYVASHPEAIGFTGTDWLYEADSAGRQYVNSIRVLAVGERATGYARPTQNDIAEGRYPFTRKIYLVNCQGTAGLGMGFASFLAGDVGQRIALKAGLVPVTYPKREIIIRNQL